MKPTHTNSEIATDYSLWRQYADPSGLDSEAEFNAKSTEEKIAFLVCCFGDEEKTPADLVSKALQDPRYPGITLYWDRQDPSNEGPAYRTDHESGPLHFLGWEGDGTGMELAAFFRGPDGIYLGPDDDGTYPVLVP
ncbi:MAG: hypothetical protein EBR82_28995 [Caulobacteraceae bacterium]|nr:hypothetical protein [Caulobacteraceae bacterium]